MLAGEVAGVAAGFRMKGESFSSVVEAPVETEDEAGAGETGAGSAFFASKGSGAAAGGKAGKGGGVHGEAALDGLGSDFVGAVWAGVSVSAFIDADSGASRFSMRTLPVWLSVRTGSASAINCSIFFIGEEGRGGPLDAAFGSAPVDVASRVGGRRTTPCMAGNVRVPVPTGPLLSGVGGVAACGPSATGTGLIAGGWGSAGTGFGLTGAGLKGGGSSDSGPGFLALKKILGHCMGVGSGAQCHYVG